MIQSKIILEGDGCWPDANPAENPKAEWIDSPLVEWARLPNGTKEGNSSISIRVNRPDGTFVMFQTSMKIFQATAAAFQGAEERDGRSHG